MNGPLRADADPAIRMVVLVLLTIDGVISAVTGALLLPIYLGTVPFPVSALIAGLVNAALVWAAGYWADSKRLAALPLWAWLVTVAAMTLGGPGVTSCSAARVSWRTRRCCSWLSVPVLPSGCCGGGTPRRPDGYYAVQHVGRRCFRWWDVRMILPPSPVNREWP